MILHILREGGVLIKRAQTRGTVWSGVGEGQGAGRAGTGPGGRAPQG